MGHDACSDGCSAHDSILLAPTLDHADKGLLKPSMALCRKVLVAGRERARTQPTGASSDRSGRYDKFGIPIGVAKRRLPLDRLIERSSNDAIIARIEAIRVLVRAHPNRKNFMTASYFHLGGRNLFTENPVDQM